jgi:3-hydroxybutyryl-CoA dehydrogenase
MRIGVVGGGLMGSGIAEVCARAGVDVTVVEADDEAAERSRARIEKSLDRGVRSGKLTAADHEAATERLAYSAALDDLDGADAAIEAIIEHEPAKRELFIRLDAILPDARFLASNTSSVPIMKLGAGTSKPERVLGLHFFNPVPVLPLVEVVRSIMTGEEALEEARSFAEDTLGKVCINSQDRAGFVVNALLIPYLLSAVRMYESGFASREDIDQGMIKGCAHPMGPLALADLIGLDTLLAVSQRSTRSSATRPRSRPRCSTAWSRRGCWGARAGAGSTTTRSRSVRGRPPAALALARGELQTCRAESRSGRRSEADETSRIWP